MALREYRKGNWTVEETMILIEAKKKDDERRKMSRSKPTLQTTASTAAAAATGIIRSSSSGSNSGSGKPITELRWKWVEEYCWGKGCFRSQNQCNDKWDNLMRDYKKVRDYQKSDGGSTNNVKSYWSMDKAERKDNGLPTNMLPQIYQALFDVVEVSNSAHPTPTCTATTIASPAPTHFLLPPPVLPPSVPALRPLSTPPSLPYPRLPPPLLPPPPTAFRLPPHPSPPLEPEHSHELELSPAKRRKEEGNAATHTAPAVAAATTAEATTTSLEGVKSEISRSATMITEEIQASQESEERRHREMTNIQESRLRIEESKLEINRQGFNGLTEAINKLAASICTWANSHKNHQGPA